METKTCIKCKETKAAELFRKSRAMCNVCVSKNNYRRYYAEKAEEINARNAKYRAENPEKMKAIYARNYAALIPSVVASMLKIPVADLTPELYALKREQILNHRALKELEQTLKALSHD